MPWMHFFDQTSVMEHDKRRQDLNLLLARVRAFIDFTKHVQDLKKANDEFLHMMEQLGEDNKGEDTHICSYQYLCI